MKSNILYAVLSIFLMLSTYCEEKMLSVDETVELALARRQHGWTEDFYLKVGRANPEARKRLYEIIFEKELSINASQAASFLAFIGTNEDVTRLNSLIDSFKDRLSDEQTALLRGCLISFSGMSKRDVQQATETLEKLLTENFWKNKQFRLHNADYKNPITEESELVLMTLNALSIIRHPNLAIMAEKVKSLQPLTPAGDIVRKRVERLLENYINSEPKKSGATEPLKSDYCYKLALLLNSKHDDISFRMLNAALNEHLKIVDALNRNEMEGVFVSLADNGLPLKLDRISRTSKSFDENYISTLKRDLKIVQDIIKRLDESNFTPSNFEVRKENVLIFKNFKVDEGSSKALMHDRWFVTIELVGTQNIMKEMFSTGTQSVAVSKTGNLLLFMIYTDGAWFWNPFGW